jgi:Aldehyde dehydrogenase family
MASQLRARHWIDGEWVDAQDRAESINPATGETIGSYTEATEAEATRTIAAAPKAFRETDWRENRRLRAKVLYPIWKEASAGARWWTEPISFAKARLLSIAIWRWKEIRFDGRIAQLVEQLTLNQRVQGSSPCAPTNIIHDLSQIALRRE